MKQFIFIAIAIVFITSLLPANLSCQMEVKDPPEFNLAFPRPVEHEFVRELDNDKRIKDWKDNYYCNSDGYRIEQNSSERDKGFIDILIKIQIFFFGDN